MGLHGSPSVPMPGRAAGRLHRRSELQGTARHNEQPTPRRRRGNGDGPGRHARESLSLRGSAGRQRHPGELECRGDVEELGGTKAEGSTKDPPFAGAKERDAVTSAQLRVEGRRLWWRLLPLSLKAISSAVLRGQEGETA